MAGHFTQWTASYESLSAIRP
ncbi:hypothetical protein CCACVL1_27466 [Corchorus capsularis]|uniref:Uncharacterized protein n=1 Tax=Corchorus capsularis TaxID=210143 RepID=A0A1R3GA41_COCAP|nr:hypothetical protein CCACVL1_27466 [Corchorus capsularis]